MITTIPSTCIGHCFLKSGLEEHDACYDNSADFQLACETQYQLGQREIPSVDFTASKVIVIFKRLFFDTHLGLVKIEKENEVLRVYHTAKETTSSRYYRNTFFLCENFDSPFKCVALFTTISQETAFKEINLKHLECVEVILGESWALERKKRIEDFSNFRMSNAPGIPETALRAIEHVEKDTDSIIEEAFPNFTGKHLNKTPWGPTSLINVNSSLRALRFFQD